MRACVWLCVTVCMHFCEEVSILRPVNRYGYIRAIISARQSKLLDLQRPWCRRGWRWWTCVEPPPPWPSPLPCPAPASPVCTALPPCTSSQTPSAARGHKYFKPVYNSTFWHSQQGFDSRRIFHFLIAGGFFIFHMCVCVWDWGEGGGEESLILWCLMTSHKVHNNRWPNDALKSIFYHSHTHTPTTSMLDPLDNKGNNTQYARSTG